MDKTAIKSKIVVVDTETTGTNPHTCKLLSMSISINGNSTYIEAKDKCFTTRFVNLQDEPFIVGHNAKYDSIVLSNAGYWLPKIYFDTMIAYYLLHIDKSRKLENILKDIWNINKDDLVAVYNKSTGENRVNLPEDWHSHIDHKLLAEYAKEDAFTTEQLYYHLAKELEALPVLDFWFHEVEMPLLNILIKMELKGVKVDRSKLNNLKEKLIKDINIKKEKLIRLSGNKEFNLDSPKQLQELLYKKFKLPIINYTATRQPSTNKHTLDELAKQSSHAFPKLLSDYKEKSKILSTYTDSLLDKLDKDDRLHTSYNQALTNTRRFSSENPNLQNIPTKSILGKEIKNCFIPSNEHRFLIADYSQLEPRILAHLSNDEWLINRFRSDEDIYLYTAEIVKKAGFKDFTRDKAKILFLALMYGKSAYGLAKDWYCSQVEAQSIIDSVYKQLTGVKAYIEMIEEKAFKTSGWLESIAGLPLYVGNPHSNNKWECMEVNRKAVNYPIQASSQDILKRAIVSIYKNLHAYPVLMVHDELVFELETWATTRGAVLPTGIVLYMEHAWKLKVPLKVEWKITDRWEK